MQQDNPIKAFIGMGSNLGDGRKILQKAWQALGEVEGIILDGISSPYTTAPVDMTSQHWFTNAVGRLQVSLSPLALLKTLLTVEGAFGRIRNLEVSGYQDRSLDLDLLYYDDIILQSPELVLPHPRIDDRLFVLVPFAELEPYFRDKQSGVAIADRELHLREEVAKTKNKEQEILRGEWDE